MSILKKHRQHLRTGLALLLGLLICRPLTADQPPRLFDLDIQVRLDDDGTAHITETRKMDIYGKATECYIVQSRLETIDIQNFSVTDERGVPYINEGGWDIDRTRDEKAGRCGIVDNGDRNYELCWGVGSEGTHTYITTYMMTNVVKGFDDADGFNHMFVARGIQPYAEHVKVTISRPDMPFDTINTRIWSFGYEGTIYIIDGKIVAESDEEFEKESGVIVMVQFEKGLFHPADVRNGSIEEMKKKAFEGSKYTGEDDFEKQVHDYLYGHFGSFFGGIFYVIFEFFLYLFAFICCCFLPTGLVCLCLPIGQDLIGKFFMLLWNILSLKPLRKILRKRRLVGSWEKLPWNRDLPCNGDLFLSNTAFEYAEMKNNTKNLLGAYILRLIYGNALLLEETPISNKKTGGIQIRIGDWSDELDGYNRDAKIVRKLYEIFSSAAGADKILQSGELRKHRNGLKALGDLIFSKANVTVKDKEKIPQVFGTKKFLEDFSIIDERGVVEVKTWNEYLVFATMFGIADQVRRDFKTICPEYFDMEKSARLMVDNQSATALVSTIAGSTISSVNFARNLSSSSSYSGGGGGWSYSGGGGRSSYSGGGGYSGGGRGGGLR